MAFTGYSHERPVCAHPQCGKVWDGSPQEPWISVFAGENLSVVQGVSDILIFDRWRCLARYSAEKVREEAEAARPKE